VEEPLSEGDRLYTSIKILDEVLFTVVGIRRIEKLRDYIRKHGYRFSEEEINKLYSFLEDMDVTVLEDKATLQEIIDITKKYHLLPADAIVALTCKHHGIKTILTFDEDFKRIPWLKVIP
jgi:predicted nucleic acid-binding protein